MMWIASSAMKRSASLLLPERLSGLSIVLMVLVLTGCSPEEKTEDLVALAFSDSVEFIAPNLGREWRMATVGKVGACTVLMVADPPPPELPQRFIPVPVDSITALRVKRASIGGDVTEPRSVGASRDSNWYSVSVQGVLRTYGGCDPWA